MYVSSIGVKISKYKITPKIYFMSSLFCNYHTRNHIYSSIHKYMFIN